MPRKTKRKKIAAEYRRRIRAISSPPPQKTSPASPPAEKPALPRVQAPANTEELVEGRRYILKDIKKTLIFSAIAICIEVMLYFVP